jgi:hypothetical protein
VKRRKKERTLAEHPRRDWPHGPCRKLKLDSRASRDLRGPNQAFTNRPRAIPRNILNTPSLGRLYDLHVLSSGASYIARRHHPYTHIMSLNTYLNSTCTSPFPLPFLSLPPPLPPANFPSSRTSSPNPPTNSRQLTPPQSASPS